MNRVELAAALAFAADGATAASGGFNAVVLLTRPAVTRDRRTAAYVLATLCAGVALQAAFAPALYTAQRFGADVAPLFAPAPWLASRALLLAGTLLLSALILRRRRDAR